FATGITPGPNESQYTVSFITTGDTNPGLFAIGPTLSSTGALTYRPATNASGTATITVEAMNSGSTANGGQNTSAPQQFTITVIPVNNPPTINPISNVTVPEQSGTRTVSLSGIT